MKGSDVEGDAVAGLADSNPSKRPWNDCPACRPVDDHPQAAEMCTHGEGCLLDAALSTANPSKRPNDRCDKCGAHISTWDDVPCVRSLTQSPRHTITRFHLPRPDFDPHLDYPERYTDGPV